MQKVTQSISPKEYHARFIANNTQHVLLDVRTPAEYAGGHIAGATNIAVQQLYQRLHELPKDRPIVLYCRTGNRTVLAAQMLNGAGYTDVYDMGGIVSWVAQGYPLDSSGVRKKIWG